MNTPEAAHTPTMSMTLLLDALTRKGISLQVIDGKLRCTHRERLTPELTQNLRAYQADIVRECSRPLLDVVLDVFGGQVLDEHGRKVGKPVKPKVQAQRALTDIEDDALARPKALPALVRTSGLALT